MMNEIENVSFHDDQIEAIRDPSGREYVVPKRICENIGLDWNTQHRKLEDDPFWSMVIMTIPSTRGFQKTCVIPLSRVAAWLFTISPNKVAPELAEKVRLYREECADVLDRHFRGTKLVTAYDNDPMVLALQAAVELRKDVLKILDEQIRLAEQQRELEQKQIEAAHRSEIADARLQSQVDTLQSEVIGYSGYLSLLAYCKKKNLHYPPAKVSGWSRKLGIYCTKHGIHWTKAHDPMYGQKSIFLESVIDDTFLELAPKD